MSDPHQINAPEPIALFDQWLAEATAAEPNDPNAAALATSSLAGEPAVRMVLAKRIHDHRFCFFTNAESRKGIHLAENPRAALCFHWKSLRRQVRIEGPITQLDAADTDAYFHSRSRESQIGATVSAQSRPLESRALLEEHAARFAAAHPGEIPRPDYWRGFCLHPQRVEFWIDGAHRLHDRFVFTMRNSQWQRLRLYP